MTPGQFNAAMWAAMEWGEGTPDQRLAQRCPEMSPAEREAAFAQCRQVTDKAYSLAPGVKSGGNDGSPVLMQAFPMLEKEMAQRAITQALYYHWRDTGE